MIRRPWQPLFTLDQIRPIAWNKKLSLQDQSHLAWCRTGPQGVPLLPGVKLGLKDHLQVSRATAQSPLEKLLVCRRLPSISLLPWIYSSRLPVRVLIVPTGTKSVRETL